ncbi:MAG: TPM domain-containing protein [Desulfuromonas sp.]|nr:TPM domain-containing protein [Desulfuromonas sp.]
MMRVLAKIVKLVLLSLFALGCVGCEKHSTLPLPTVVDEAQLLSSVAEQRIERLAASMLEHQRIELQVYTLAEVAGDLDALAVELVEQQRLGQRSGSARGLLLLVDPQAEQVRVEVGYDLEGVFSDLLIARIERQQMAPFFAANRVGDGIEASLELLVAEQPQHESAPAAAREKYSGGAGARSAMTIDQPLDAEFIDSNDEAARRIFVPQPSPLAALECYQQILARHIKDPELTIYTAATREFFAGWLVTDAQQNNELRDLERIFYQAEVYEQDSLAVIRFSATERHCPPYLLQRSKQGWQLDFSTMSKTIGFNHRNQWFFRHLSHPFMFAFSDWRFDDNGYPYTK